MHGLVLALTAATLSAPPATLSVQGALTNAGGVVDGTYAVNIALYPQEAGGDAFFTQSASLEVVAGVFSTVLNGMDPTDFAKPGDVWVGVTVGTEPELPRTRIASAPFALASQSAAGLSCSGCLTLAHLSGEGCAQGQLPRWNGKAWKCGDNVKLNGSLTAASADIAKVGIGSTSVEELTVKGMIRVEGHTSGDTAMIQLVPTYTAGVCDVTRNGALTVEQSNYGTLLCLCGRIAGATPGAHIYGWIEVGTSGPGKLKCPGT